MTLQATRDDITRAEVLVEALPFIQRFQGHTMVIKLGGAAIEQGSPRAVLQDIVLLSLVGIHPVLVHGGGPAITEWQGRVGLEPKFVDGLRVTDEQTMEIVKMVLTGKVGPELVATIHQLGGNAIGMSGEDGPILLVNPLEHEGGVDLGFVGEIAEVHVEPIQAVIEQGRIPVIASIGLGYNGHSYNVNADVVAAELAVALSADKLLLLTDVAGVADSDGSLISELDSHQAERLIASRVINSGMIPKVRSALSSLRGVNAAHILDGRVEHALMLELLTEHGVGTMLVPGRGEE